MRKRSLFFSIYLLMLVFILPALALADVNAGFIPAPIWLSNSAPTAGQTITISTLVYNQGATAIYGDVSFYDNGTLLGKKSVTVAASASKVVSISWKATAGDHAVKAMLENTRQTSGTGAVTKVSSAETSAYHFTVLAPPVVEPLPLDSSASGVKTATPDSSKSDISNTADEAKVAAENAYTKVDAWRDETGTSLINNVDQAQKDLQAAIASSNALTPNTITGPKQFIQSSFLQTPFAYVKLFFYQTAQYVFSHKPVFYGVIILFVFLFIRFLVRLPR